MMTNSYSNNSTDFKSIFCLLIIFSICTFNIAIARKKTPPQNYYYEKKALLDIQDPLGDDKGPGYYRYPLDDTFKKGTFDIKRFTVYEEGKMLVFEIQMRNYIIRRWQSGQTEHQGFVANMWDIYIDLDGDKHSGYNMALPGRDIAFANNMGWEKVILITPLSERTVYNILRERTDEIEFQNRIDDIIIPDHVIIKGNKVTVKVEKETLPNFSNRTGFQLFSMGFSNVVSYNRLLNKDVRAFPTAEDFGGGFDAKGNPTILDMIVPKDMDQYEILKNYSAAHFYANIVYASVPFVYQNLEATPPPRLHPVNRDPLMTNVKKPILENTEQTLDTIPTIAEQKPSSEIPPGFLPIKTGE